MVLRYCAICVIPTLVYTLYCMCWLRSQKCQIVCLTHCSDLFIQWLEWIRKRNQSIHAWVVYKTFAFSLYYPQTGFLCVILCFHHHILNGTEGIFFFVYGQLTVKYFDVSMWVEIKYTTDLIRGFPTGESRNTENERMFQYSFIFHNQR